MAPTEWRRDGGLYPHLTLNYTPKLELVENVVAALAGAALGVAAVTLRQRWSHVLGAFKLSEWAWLAFMFATGVTVARVFLLDRRHQAESTSRLVPPAQAADADSQFRHVLGLRVHYKRRARVDAQFARRYAACLWHGFGANTYSWETKVLRRMTDALGPGSLVVAHDCPGFGLTERSKDVSKYTIGFNGSLGRSLLDAEVKETAASEDADEADFSRVYIGHSMGAWAAAQAAVEAGEAGAPSVLVLVAPAFVLTSSKTSSSPANMLKVFFAAIRGIITSLILALWRPLCKPLLAMVLRANVSSQQFWKKGLQGAWHQPNLVTNDLVDGYRRPSTVQDWDEGLLRFVEANTLKLGGNNNNTTNRSDSATLTEKLAALVAAGRTRVLVVHGKQDRLVPLSNSRRLAKAVGARCVEIDGCGHVPMEEAPIEFLAAVERCVGANK